MRVTVKVIKKEKEENYGEKIIISSPKDLDLVISRAAGASVLYGDEKVKVEFDNSGEKLALEGYQKIKENLESYEFLEKLLTSTG
ncbi:hypothetical protein J7J37_00985 [bacterium]|nr:hypothetical protein [bacterium]